MMKSKAGYKHDPDNRGMSRMPLYHIWKAMLRRCKSENDPAFRNYGARGIRVCEEWHKFAAFNSGALEQGHAHGLDVDRIDNDGPYSPENCRLVTRRINARNTRQCLALNIDGQTMTAVEAAESFGIHYITLLSRLRRGWSLTRARRWDGRMRRLQLTLAAGLLAGCAAGPTVIAQGAGCSSLVPETWAQGVAGADLPEGNTVGDWIVFGDAQTGRLDQANGRTKDSIGIVKRCEDRDAAALKRARRGFLGRLFG